MYKQTSFKIIALILCIVLMLGAAPLTAFGSPQTQNNRVFDSRVFTWTDGAWQGMDNNAAKNTSEAHDLRRLFDRFFQNDLVGVHLTEHTTRIAVRPFEGVTPVKVEYNPETNSFRTLAFNRVCANGFWIFDVPANTAAPLNIVVSNGTLVSGAKPAGAAASFTPPIVPTTSQTSNNDRGRDSDLGNGGGGGSGGGGGGTQPPVFIAVMDIIKTSTDTIQFGIPLALAASVTPNNATNQAITWSVQSAGGTGATITGNALNTTAAGTATIRATVVNGATATTDFTRDFVVTVTSTPQPFVAVSSITNVPTAATVGTPLALTGTVNTSNAINYTISWSVQNAGGTGATITGNTLNTTAAGTATIRATVVNGTAVGTNYTQDFPITVTAPPVNAQTPNITGQPTGATVIIAGFVNLTGTATSPDGGTLSYQWYSNTTNNNTGGTAISGANSANHIPNTFTQGTVYYYVVVTNTNTGVNGNQTATATSNTATVTVNPLPTWSISLNQSGTHNFGTVNLGYVPQTPLSVTVNNTGNQPTGNLTVGLSGTNASSFTLLTTSISSINASDSDSFTVVPNTGLAAGTYTATVTVSGTPSSQTFSVSFTVDP